ncbi:iron-containing alcohol dehydrogenase [Leucobacter sp. M11]|uniref:iron-containing alcohol dehydrogenase n=1 Tax=Leucobacter sp. M11 TaxID=2993565 RepID=UPI002D7EF89C|nr:iron-containing alcohol dehydrogenase [Leucobacter sp. M11]MEB4616346.1 iron-containing alcohol dehydrogenase [Leucobacter sp. M11]
MVHHISVPPILRIGGGALNDICEVVAQVGAARALIVTDRFLTTSGVPERIRGLLGDAGIPTEIFDGTVPDPTTDSLEAGLCSIQEHGADVLIALGGGSPIDSAKALAVLSLHGGEMRDLKAPISYRGPALPIIAIPTTAGTGSEATQFTVITDAMTGEKMLCGGPSYLPRAAIVDYELTVSMPSRLTADTGLDALTHAVEAYVSSRSMGFTDALALHAIRQIGRSLRRAVDDGEDSLARAEMMEAATLAGIAFSNASVALVHGMSRPLGAKFHIAHGMANAMLFAEVTEYSLDSALPRYADCARALGVSHSADSNEAAASALVRELYKLRNELGVPSPEQLGIARVDWDRAVPEMAAQALASGSPANNPRIPTQEDVEALFLSMYSPRG